MEVMKPNTFCAGDHVVVVGNIYIDATPEIITRGSLRALSFISRSRPIDLGYLIPRGTYGLVNYCSSHSMLDNVVDFFATIPEHGKIQVSCFASGLRLMSPLELLARHAE